MIEVWIDGACVPINPGGTGCIGCVIKKNGIKIAEASKIIGKGKGMTNNVAEYNALIFALRRLRQLRLENEDIIVKSDSNLLVNQMNCKWKVTAFNLMPLVREARTLAANFHIKIEWIPREENEEADRLANSAYAKSLEEMSKIESISEKTSENLDSYL